MPNSSGYYQAALPLRSIQEILCVLPWQLQRLSFTLSTSILGKSGRKTISCLKTFAFLLSFTHSTPDALINVTQYMQVRGCEKQDVPEDSATVTAAPSAEGSKRATPRPKSRDGFRMFHRHKMSRTDPKSRGLSRSSTLLRVHADEKFISIELRASLRAKRGEEKSV